MWTTFVRLIRFCPIFWLFLHFSFQVWKKLWFLVSFFFSSCDWRRSTNWPNIHFIFVFVCHLVNIILTCNKLTIRLKFKRKLIMKNKLFTKYLIKKSRFLSYLIVCNCFVLLANPIHFHFSSFCLNWLIDSIYSV